MSFTGNKAAQSDKVYFDMSITNVDAINVPPQVLTMTEQRTTPLILCPEDYYLSIVRFQIDCPTLPIFTPVIQYNQSNTNLSVYSFTLEWTDPSGSGTYSSGQTYMTYAPQNLAVLVPGPPSAQSNGLQNNSSTYYDCYNPQYVIYLFNQTLATAYAALLAAVTSGGKTLPSPNIPVITWDTTLNTAIMNCDVAGYDTTSSNYIAIYLNQAMAQLFNTWPYYYLSATALKGKNLQLQTTTFGGQNVSQFPGYDPSYSAIQVYQNGSTYALWCPISSLVFCSNTMPIIPNAISAPQLLINGAQLIGNNGNNNNVSQILTDFVADSGQYQGQLTYEPTAQYRLVSMTGNQPLSKVDISVFYQDQFGIFQPFRLSSGSRASIKFLFTKKSSVIDKSQYP